MHIEDGMTVQQKAGENVAPIDFPVISRRSQPIFPPRRHDEVGADSQEPARPDRRVLGADLVEANRRQPRSPRRERRVMADGIVPAIIWVVLFGGAFLTIGFTFFFGAENLRAQSVRSAGSSIVSVSASASTVACTPSGRVARLVPWPSGSP